MLRSSDNKHLLLIGGGHAHVGILQLFREKGLPVGAKVTLIGDQPLTPYSGMLPAALAGEAQVEDLMFDLPRLCQLSNANFIRGRVIHVNSERGEARYLAPDETPGEKTLRFDLASFDVGGRPLNIESDQSVPVMAVKPISELLPKWTELIQALAQWSRPQHPRVAVIGGGVSGVEIAMALASRTKELHSRPLISLWQRSALLEGHSKWARRLVHRYLDYWQVKLRLGVEVLRVNNHRLEFQSVDSARDLSGGRGRGGLAREIVDAVILATPVAAPDFFRQSELPVDAQGFVLVQETLQVVGKQNLFATGDCLSFPTPLPKAGVYPVRQIPVLDHNLRSLLRGLELRGLEKSPQKEATTERQDPSLGSGAGLKPYKPQNRALALITAGRGRAIGSYGPIAFSGDWVWRWKDRIDRQFMAKMRK